MGENTSPLRYSYGRNVLAEAYIVSHLKTPGEPWGYRGVPLNLNRCIRRGIRLSEQTARVVPSFENPELAGLASQSWQQRVR